MLTSRVGRAGGDGRDYRAADRVQYHENADNRWRGGSLALGTLIEQFCFAQVEFAFDAAP
jgi:hypothetical protein